jgi:uncharacterized protein with LGFP repeats
MAHRRLHLSRLSLGHSGKRRRMLLVLLTGLLILSGASTTAYLFTQPRAAHGAVPTPVPPATGSAVDVILLHGFSVSQNNDCDGTWGDVISYLQSNGWTGPTARGSLVAMNFYASDTDCHAPPNSSYAVLTNTLYQYRQDGPPGLGGQCQHVGVNLGAEGTTSEDLQRLGCKLAWYIYNNYTHAGRPVMVVAHSMGGLIIRSALEESTRNSSYPGAIWVPAVVTMGTPHQGLSNGLSLGCGVCFQVEEMSSNSPFMTDLQSNGLNPQGDSHGTGWMTMAMQSEDVNQCYLSNPINNGAADLPDDPIGANMSGAYQVTYEDPCYGHGGYLIDPSVAEDGLASFCGGCSGSAAMDSWGFYRRSLQNMEAFLFIHLPGGTGAYNYGQHSGLYWSLGTGTHDMIGDMFTKYVRTGGPVGSLGFPKTDRIFITNTPTNQAGGAQMVKFAGSGCTVANQGSAMYYFPGQFASETIGPYFVQGCVYQKYLIEGDVTGWMGFPTSDEQAANGGHYNTFAGSVCGSNQSGSGIYDLPSVGAREVDGCIYQKYLGLQGTAGILGYPKTDEQSISDGTSTGHVSYFVGSGCSAQNQGSAIYSHNGEFEVHGCIFQEYLNRSGPAGVLGFPTTDEQPIGSGHVNYFASSVCGSNSGSAIYDLSSLGAHEVHGCIYQKYLSLGGPTGVMGFPMSDEYAVAGGAANDFAGPTCNGAPSGHIYYSTAGAYMVKGCIAVAYLNDGGPGGALGFPLADERTITGGWESDFQNGYITFDASTGQATIHLYGGGTHCPPICPQ